MREQVAKNMGGVIGISGQVERIIEEEDVEEFEEKLLQEQESMRKKF